MSESVSPPQRLPSWLKSPIGRARDLAPVQRLIKQAGIHTICEEGRCPNRGECYRQGTATFLLMGPICTRACGFCQVDKGHAPRPVDEAEPLKIAQAVQALGLQYVVLTSVARDDLADQGVGHFIATMTAIRHLNPNTAIEVLTPDFRGHQELIGQIVQAQPVCYNHNLETVRRLQGPVRRGAKYERSLEVLATVKRLNPDIPTKSGLMLGLGETTAEVIATLQDLRAVDCNRLTLGQYLAPSLVHLPVVKYWHPDEFQALGQTAKEMGFAQVRSGPLVRSSYHASHGEDP
ncbi:lipoyl synthase [Thermosynechococcaceae cyanobacterium BACA0444]|uniref:Lipoyl synthase n=1 Tax=Pseudocalidococcus azoricus BACA0444 TaxID=2918990 RepID=A0AAE4FPJ8_9CYAN|nr:lipoyl synthase [Pseudocalidococcus azoricus]MDS3859923.1 lipoyl synthase [Pseudocalidococcus azoricus BACA0444]